MNIVSTITGAFTDWISGMTKGIVDAFTGLFLTSEGAISQFGIFALTFLGIGVATGLTYGVVRMVRSR